jgi:TonB family protein
MTVEWKPGYRVFWENIRDALVAGKLPPLPVSTKGVKVREVWSKHERFYRVQVLSASVHALVVVLLVIPFLHQISQVTQVQTVKADVKIIDISPYLPLLPPGGKKAGGGGGGGERLPTPPSKGRLPKFSMTHLTPPFATIRNPQPKLPVEPTVLGPPEIRLPNPPLPNYGDPLAQLITGSGGPGGGGGIGTCCCGGVGSGEGGGVVPGSGGGIGGGVFQAGRGGVGEPECIYCPNPTFSDEAVKAKYQGPVLARVIINAEGRVVQAEIVKGLGLGLDERVLQAVRTWRFKPALGPGSRPVAVSALVEVTYRLL